MLALLILIVCFLVREAISYACKYIDFRGLGLTIKRRVGSSIKKMKPVEAKPAPELRTSLIQNRPFSEEKSPYVERVFDHETYDHACSAARMFGAAYPRTTNYYETKVIPGKESEQAAWEEARKNPPDHTLAAEMERLFNKITADDPMSTQIKIQIQLLWDDTFLPMIKLAHQTGESGRESYENQVKMLAKVIKELERRYELGMQAKQSLYTNYLTDLVNDLTPARPELSLEQSYLAAVEKSNRNFLDGKNSRAELFWREMMNDH